jgi:hypothetical protein
LATRAIGPKLIMGMALGFLIGMVALASLSLALALVFIGLWLLGRPRSTRGVNTPFGRRMSPEDASAVISVLVNREAEDERLRPWRAGRDTTPGGSIPGTPINLDRPFAAYTDCERGHQDFHLIGATFHDGRQKWINRSCTLDGCDSAWREKA